MSVVVTGGLRSSADQKLHIAPLRILDLLLSSISQNGNKNLTRGGQNTHEDDRPDPTTSCCCYCKKSSIT